MANYVGQGGIVISGIIGATSRISKNPARCQPFKFYLGERCSFAGATGLLVVERATFDNRVVTYVLSDGAGNKFEMPERLCLTETEWKDYLIYQESISYNRSEINIQRLSMGG